MTFQILASFLWGAFLSLFVLSPLFNSTKEKLAGTKHNKVQNLLRTKNFLFAKCAYGSCEEQSFNQMNEQEAFNCLIDVCEQLDAMGVSLAEKLEKQNLQKGSSCVGFVGFLFCALLGVTLFAFISPFAFGEQSNESIPKNVKIPPPTILQNGGYWLPSVNQFILIPAQGYLQVYYVGMFSNDFQAKGTKVLLPFPKNISNLTLQVEGSALMETPENKNADDIILNTPLKEGINQIQAQFNLVASAGVAHWKKNSLDNLPGVTIFIMPEYSGVLQSLFSHFIPELNIWPARIVQFPADFRSILSREALVPDANKNGDSHELSQQYVRVGGDTALFPEFKIVGIVPDRFSIYLFVLFFTCFFVAALFIFIFKLRS